MTSPPAGPPPSGDEPVPDTTVERTAVVVGIGVRPGADAEKITRAVESVVGDTATVTCLATIDRRAPDPGVRAAAAALGVPVVAFSAAQLAEVGTPHRSPRTARAVGTPSVAEAAALLAGRGELLCGRTIVDGVVIAVATIGASAPN
ncbi:MULTISPECIES: cobalamin biosynthesis protein [unclassified Nocardia]|uniref:cobalamin biosynthesis protein n=1 Tax=unclassified Nocardia TaxID=2637762 RepID=UPI0033B02AF5